MTFEDNDGQTDGRGKTKSVLDHSQNSLQFKMTLPKIS